MCATNELVNGRHSSTRTFGLYFIGFEHFLSLQNIPIELMTLHFPLKHVTT